MRRRLQIAFRPLSISGRYYILSLFVYESTLGGKKAVLYWSEPPIRRCVVGCLPWGQGFNRALFCHSSSICVTEGKHTWCVHRARASAIVTIVGDACSGIEQLPVLCTFRLLRCRLSTAGSKRCVTRGRVISLLFIAGLVRFGGTRSPRIFLRWSNNSRNAM